MSSFVLLSKFPSEYMKSFLIGQGVGGIFSSALQVLSLAIGTSSEASALIYFMLGSLLTSVTLALFYLSKNMTYYQYHIDNSVEDTKRDIIKVPELIDVSSKVWSSLVIVTASALAFVPTHPSIASLVVSEDYGKGNSWNGKIDTILEFVTDFIVSLNTRTDPNTPPLTHLQPKNKIHFQVILEAYTSYTDELEEDI